MEKLKKATNTYNFISNTILINRLDILIENTKKDTK